MYSAFLREVQALTSFEEHYGVSPRSTSLGFTLPDYASLGEPGLDAWERHYGQTACATPGSTPFSVLTACPPPLRLEL